MTTQQRAYTDDDNDLLVLRQQFPDSVAAYGLPDNGWAPSGTAYPSFRLGKAKLNASGADALRYISWGFQQIPYGGEGAPFPVGYPQGIPDVHGGAPLALVDPQDPNKVLLIGPLTRFASAVCAVADNELRCGLQGAADSLPANASLETLLVASDKGVAQAVMRYGEALRRFHGGKPLATESAIAEKNAQASTFGYATTGHYFYALGKGLSAGGTLAAVKAGLDKAGVAIGWVLIDSWWYGENGMPQPNGSFVEAPWLTAAQAGGGALRGGVWRWDDVASRWPGAFPDGGWKALSEALGVPFIAHMGMWVGNASKAGPPPYAADYPWSMDSNASVPVGAEFWEWLFPQAAEWGIMTVKLDHTQTQIPETASLKSDMFAADDWLTTMAETAAKHGIGKMMGGAPASGFLHSVTLPDAIVARVGNDYIPGIHRPSGSCGDADGLAGSRSDGGGGVTIRRAGQGQGLDGAPISSRSSPRRLAEQQQPQQQQGVTSASQTQTPEWGNSETCARIAHNSLLPFALGLLPYKDSVLSMTQDWSETTCAQGTRKFTFPEWFGLQERYPALHMAVSALSAGPVSVCDGVGQTDVALVRRAARADGGLLKPARPALAVGERWRNMALGGGEDGEVSETYSDVPLVAQRAGEGDVSATAAAAKLRFHLALGFALPTAYDLPVHGAEGMGATASVAHAAWAWRGEPRAALDAKDVRLLQREGSDSKAAPVVLPMVPMSSADAWGEFTLWKTAPVLCAVYNTEENGTGLLSSGVAVLGDLHAVVSASHHRLESVEAECGAHRRDDGGNGGSAGGAGGAVVTVTVVGARGEAVNVTAAVVSGGAVAAVVTASCVVGASGQAKAKFPEGTC